MDDLAYYIAIYYPHLLTEEERLAQWTLLGEAKVRSAEHPELKRMLGNRWISKDPAVLKLLSDGPDAFWARLRERVMRDSPNEVFLNNCPRCAALAKTPTAKQCPKCFYSWHDEP